MSLFIALFTRLWPLFLALFILYSGWYLFRRPYQGIWYKNPHLWIIAALFAGVIISAASLMSRESYTSEDHYIDSEYKDGILTRGHKEPTP